VEKALYYGWKDYFNLILKSGEIVQFNKMIKYIVEPSLEIGCGGCHATNMIFRDSINSITFGCEFFMDNFMDVNGKLNDEMYKVIKHYVGGSIESLPFKSDLFNSVIMIHIIDHIVNINQWYKEIHRILKQGGYLVMTGYSKNVFDHLPGVKFRKLFSTKWAKNYKEWRITKENFGGAPFKSNFEHDATGQNILSIKEWETLSLYYGFELVDFAFFGNFFLILWISHIEGIIILYFLLNLSMQ
jgi:ubiquinone/menaquinone biosynthesis C-methylase UbiE